MPASSEWSCAQTEQSYLLAWGELAAADIVAVVRHLLVCPACRETLEGIARVRAAYDLLDDAVPPQAFAAVHQRIRDEARSARTGGWRGGPARAVARAAAIVIAAAGLVLAGVWSGARVAGGTAGRSAHGTAALVIAASRAELASDTWTVRIQGAARLGTVAAEDEVVAMLMGVVAQDPSPNVRLAAIDALRRRDPGTLRAPALEALLAGEPSPVLRLALVELLVTQVGAEAAAPLRSLLEWERDPAVRRRAAAALQVIS